MRIVLIPSAYEPDPDRVLFARVVSVTDGRVRYACPDDLWPAHHLGWVRERRRGNDTAAEPFPAGHCMFADPTSYACVPYDKRHDPRIIRRAHRARVVADLDGYDRELRKTRDGMRTLARIVRETVALRVNGQNVGALPFLACIAAEL